MSSYKACEPGALAGSPLLSAATRVVVLLGVTAVLAVSWLEAFPGKPPAGAEAANQAVIHVTLPRVEVVGRGDECGNSTPCRTHDMPLQSSQAGPDRGEPGLTQVNLRQ